MKSGVLTRLANACHREVVYALRSGLRRPFSEEEPHSFQPERVIEKSEGRGRNLRAGLHGFEAVARQPRRAASASTPPARWRRAHLAAGTRGALSSPHAHALDRLDPACLRR